MSIRLATGTELSEAAEQIHRADRVAVDTEFHAERRYVPKLYLVQVSVPAGDTWVLDPLVDGTLAAVRDALCATPWVVHGGFQDMRVLRKAFGDLPDRIVDTQIAAGLVGTAFPASYADLCQRYLDLELAKTATLSDWSRRPLTAAQIAYAAEDAQLLLSLVDALLPLVAAQGRSTELELACAAAREVVIEPPPVDDAWKVIRAASTLDPDQAGVMQELAAWREQTARDHNQPARSVLSDGVLIELARRQPITVESLGANRRVAKSVMRKHGTTLVELIARSAARPAWSRPAVLRQRTPGWRRRAWLQAFAETLAEARRFAVRLVLPTDLLDTLALAPPATREAVAAVLGPWRDALCGDAVHAAVTGRIQLGLDVQGADVVLMSAAAADPGSTPRPKSNARDH